MGEQSYTMQYSFLGVKNNVPPLSVMYIYYISEQLYQCVTVNLASLIFDGFVWIQGYNFCIYKLNNTIIFIKPFSK